MLTAHGPNEGIEFLALKNSAPHIGVAVIGQNEGEPHPRVSVSTIHYGHSPALTPSSDSSKAFNLKAETKQRVHPWLSVSTRGPTMISFSELS